jgi:hypothetical protein
MPILAHPDAVLVGLDVHKDSISAGVLNPGCASGPRQSSRLMP